MFVLDKVRVDKYDLSVTTTQDLYELQQLDWEIDSLEGNLTTVRSQLLDNTILIDAKNKATKLEREITQLTKEHLKQNQISEQLADKTKTIDTKLYSGSIKNPKELESLQSELSYLETQNREVEEHLLNLMISIDEEEKQAHEVEGNLQEAIKTKEASEITLNKKLDILNRQLNTLRIQRQKLTTDITPPHLLKQYERIRQARHGHAVAKLERGMCTGCRLTIPTKELQKVKISTDLILCNSCGRILFMG